MVRWCSINTIISSTNSNKKKINLPVCILNIGGIANITIINKPIGSDNFYSRDIGPGNCLIDKWLE